MSTITAFVLPSIIASSLTLSYPVPFGQPINPGELIEPERDVVELEQDRTKRMTVPVSIDGKGPFSFVIDTGAERTILSEAIAAHLGLEADEQVDLVSIAGRSQVETVYVPEMTMGRKSYGGIVAPVLQAEHIGADGILGLDSLQNRRVLFDFVKKQLVVEEVGAPGAAKSYREIIVKGRRRSGQLIFTKASIAGIPIDVVIDTGGQVTIGNFALQKKLRQRARDTDDDSLLIAVTGDELDVEMGRVSDFRMAKARFSNMLIAFADAPPFASLNLDRKPAVLLGMDALSQFDKVAIDFEKRQVHLLIPKNAGRYKEATKASRLQNPTR